VAALLLDAALRYADYGWPVFPCYSARSGACCCRKGADCRHPAKHPHTRHGLKDGTIESRQIRRWWSKWPDANVAIVTGADSDLLVIDVDQAHGGPNSLEGVLLRLGALPDHPVARTGGGGNHRLFKHPGGRVANRQAVAEGIDVRADGGYIIAPSSRHASGNPYEWQIDPEIVPPPTLPELWLEWLSSMAHRNTEAQDIVGGYGGRVVWDGLAMSEVVRRAVEATLPAAFGQRHGCLFRFARWLKSHPAIHDAPAVALKPYLRQWHQAALPKIRTKPFEDSWFDFAESWQKVKHPIGAGPMGDILRRAAAADPPAVAMQYEQEELRLLVSLCRELQREAGKRPFYLSVRTAAEQVGVSPRHAARWLKGLVIDGILKLVRKGDRRKREASEYRYMGGGV